MKKNIYLILCVLGIALPYWQFLPWVAANGLNLRLFFQQLFANRIGVFFGMDVLVSAFALLFFVRFESSRMRIRDAGCPDRCPHRRCLARFAFVSLPPRTRPRTSLRTATRSNSLLIPRQTLAFFTPAKHNFNRNRYFEIRSRPYLIFNGIPAYRIAP